MRKNLPRKKRTNKKAVDDFTKANATKLKDIEDENKRITINQQYANAYNRLIQQLKLTRNQLPATAFSGAFREGQRVLQYNKRTRS